MEKNIRKKYMKDMLTIIVFIILTWFVIGYVGFEIISINNDISFKILFIVVMFFVLVTSTLACISLINHLTFGKNEIYEIDLLYLNKIDIEGVGNDE